MIILSTLSRAREEDIRAGFSQMPYSDLSDLSDFSDEMSNSQTNFPSVTKGKVKKKRSLKVKMFRAAY